MFKMAFDRSRLVKKITRGVMVLLLSAVLVIPGMVLGTPLAAASNPVPVQYFYLPFPEDQLLETLQTIQPGDNHGGIPAPDNPVTTYVSISALASNTVIYYDQWENGYEADIANPVDLYSAANPAGVQIWGDGILENGAAPGLTGDVVTAGSVILLNNNVYTQTRQSVIDFDGGDKFAVTKTVAVTHTAWASGSSTLLAGSVEVYDTVNWGTDYRAPVGTNIPDSLDYQMFEYTALYIMAGEDATTVQIDTDADGVFDITTTLDEGESYCAENVYAGGRVLSDKPVQVDIFTGDIGSNYESRDSALAPFEYWTNSYYTPVSTASSVGNYNGTDTTVWLYNPGESAITVYYQRRGWSGYSTSAISVSSQGWAKQVLENGYSGRGSHFYSDSTFYAFSTTDSNNAENDHNDYYYNQAWDWGYSLVPQGSLSPQVLVGLGIGKDPTYQYSSWENGNPVWVTTIGNGDEEVTVYIDYDADPATGSLIDPSGNHYDSSVQLKELAQAKIYNPYALDQTGMLIYVLDPEIKLAAAWGQDPATASPADPGLDVGTCVPPAPLFDCGKNGTLSTDNDGDGFISPGDEILYTITINNIGRLPVPDMVLLDVVPEDTTYVEGSTFWGGTSISDDSTPASAFPLDEDGFTFPENLAVGESFTVTFKVVIDSFTDLTSGTTRIVNAGTVTAFGSTGRFLDSTPLYGRISDLVWNDANNNGLQDPGEEGIAGVTVQLLDSEGNLIAVTTTDSYGCYVFTGLLPGEYIVSFSAPEGFSFTLPDQGEDETLDSNPDGTSGQTTVILQAGQNNNTVDAGLWQSVPGIDLLKIWTGYTDVDEDGLISEGDILDYSYTVTNTGTVTLSGVKVEDTPIGLIVLNDSDAANGADVLSPGEIQSGYAVHQVTSAEVSLGKVYNHAVATGTSPSEKEVTDEDEVTLVALVIQKNTLSYDDTFSFEILQNGNLYDSLDITTVECQGQRSIYVTPGTYSIEENLLPQWVLNSAAVVPESAGTPDSFTVDDETVTVVFNNYKEGDPNPPVPEMPALILLAGGLLAIGVIVAARKYRFGH